MGAKARASRGLQDPCTIAAAQVGANRCVWLVMQLPYCCATNAPCADERCTEKQMPLHPTWQVLTLPQLTLPTCEGAQRKQADTLKRKTSQGEAPEDIGEEDEGGRATPLGDTPAS